MVIVFYDDRKEMFSDDRKPGREADCYDSSQIVVDAGCVVIGVSSMYNE